MNTLDYLRTDVVRGAKLIYKKGLVDLAEGNVSVRISELDELIITPTYNNYETMKKNDMVHIDFSGKYLGKSENASSEYRLHVSIYRARPNAECVIHTHSPYASMLSISRKRIPVLMEEMVVLLGGSVDVSDFGITHTDIFGVNALKSLGKKNAALLANHGVLVCGRSIDHAVKIAELVEKMAFLYWGSIQIGNPIDISDKIDIKLLKIFQKDFSSC
jgi:ribulose-5-phosphate 4-epimerase/fuculose-1-phosphate aldolase